MTRSAFSWALFAPLMLSLHAEAADIALYPTGPDQDSAFLRFINAADHPLQLLAEGSRASLKLEGTHAVSDYLPVPANQPIKGTLERNGKSQPLDIQVAAGEFASVIALPDSAQGIRQVVIREQPDDFNSLRASLAFISADPACTQAGLRAAGKNADLFKEVADGSVQRRAINPVNLWSAPKPTSVPRLTWASSRPASATASCCCLAQMALTCCSRLTSWPTDRIAPPPWFLLLSSF